MSAAPDLIEPVLGFRAWHVDAEGGLCAWSFRDHAWTPGPNRAVCLTDPDHAAPDHNCMCGLYALASERDDRLRSGGDQAVGAVAGWGDVELHRTGFRAEWACVLALARPAGAPGEAARRLELAAKRYGVALVPRAELAEAGLRHAQPAPARAPRRPAPRVPAPEAWDPATPIRRGLALDEHLWVETTPQGVRLGITRAFAARLRALDAGVALPPAGRAVEAHDALTALGGADGTYHVISPAAGVVTEVNPALGEHPELLLEDPNGRGWLLALSPTGWTRDRANVVWGPSADRAYRAEIAGRRDAFARLCAERVRALPPVHSWADVAAVLRRERSRPLFASGEELQERLGGALRDRLAETPRVRAALARLPGEVVLRCTEPGATLCLRAGGPDRAAVLAGEEAAAPAGAVELSMSADVAYGLFTGAVDSAVALRTGSLCSSADRTTTLTYLSVLAHLRIPPLRRLASWER